MSNALAVPGQGTAQPQTVQEFQRMLEETKKEVREIRAIEAQMRWNMAREEVKGKANEEAAELNEIRDWRWKQSDEMKVYVAEKAQQTKAEELQESRKFQEFKREIKEHVKEEDLKYIQEEYQQDTENAAWRAEAAKEVYERDKELTAGHAEDIQFLRELRSHQKEQEKAEENEARALEQSLEMAKMARELAKEKDKLLQSLQYVRSCQKNAALGSSRGSSGRPSTVNVARQLPS